MIIIMAGANASVVINSLKTQLSWGGELHQCFVTAVQSLGGYFNATPKVGPGSSQCSLREPVWVGEQLGMVWASSCQRWRTLQGNETPLPGILVFWVRVQLFHIHARWPANGPMYMAMACQYHACMLDSSKPMYTWVMQGITQRRRKVPGQTMAKPWGSTPMAID
jgi:hypothetical protein